MDTITGERKLSNQMLKPKPFAPLCAILGNDVPPSLVKLKPSQRNLLATTVNLAKLERERLNREAAYDEGNVANKHAINRRRRGAQDDPRRIAVKERTTAKRTKPLSPTGSDKDAKAASKYLSGDEKLTPIS